MLTTPVTMKKISLYMMDSDAQQAAMALARLSVIHPFEDQGKMPGMEEYPVRPYFDVYHSLNSRFDKITSFVSTPFTPPANIAEIVTLEQLQQLDEELKTLWPMVSEVEEKLRAEREKKHATQQLYNSLQKFLTLDLDLSRLRKPSRFLKILVGTIPTNNFLHLQRALSLASFMIKSFYAEEGINHVVVIGSSLQQQDAQELLKSADFRELVIPEELSGNPSQLQADIYRQLLETNDSIRELRRKLSELLLKYSHRLQAANDLLVLARPYASLANVLKGKGSLVCLHGWVPAYRQGEIIKELQESLNFPFHSEFTSPQIREFDSVPSLMEHSRLLKPFQSLVGNFGIPNYAEIDPTGLFALSYILMFGMMFGDVGHGLVIVLAGLLFWKRFPAVTIVSVLAGMSSMVFGFVYGSLFGYETIIEPIWMSPMHNPTKVLLVAVVWGAGFLLVANLLAIRNYLAIGLVQQALYSGKGLAGMAFYLAALFGGYQLMANDQFGWLEWLLLLAPVAVMVRYQWQHSTAGLFERTLVVLIETLEHFISSISGTLSFLRVAAFSLNHIALAAAVFTIAAMLDTTGHWITIVLGNIFIIVLEGAIVAIQCLRLEYYEGFSRFFSGQGKAFEPLRLDI